MTSVQAVIESCQEQCLNEIETNGCWGDAQLHAQFVAHLLGVSIRVLVMPENTNARFHESPVHVFHGRGGNQKVRSWFAMLSCFFFALETCT
jgi:hypothetical protein